MEPLGGGKEEVGQGPSDQKARPHTGRDPPAGRADGCGQGQQPPDDIVRGLLALPAAVCAPCGRIPPRVRTGLLIGGALAYFLFAAAQGFHGVYPYRGIWERAMIP